MLSSCIQIGHLKYIQLGHKLSQGRQGYPGKIHPAKLKLFNHCFLVSENTARIDLYLHPAPGLFIYQLCKFISSLGGGIILRLILSICQDELRNCLLRRAVLASACTGRGQNHYSGAAHEVNHIFSQAAVPPFAYIIPQLPDPVKEGLSFNYAHSCLPL